MALTDSDDGTAEVTRTCAQGHRACFERFKHALRDLDHLDEDLEVVLILAKQAGIEIPLADARAYVVARAKA